MFVGGKNGAKARLKPTLDSGAAPQIECLKRCGPLDLAEIACEGSQRGGARKNEELGGLRLGPHGGGCSFVFVGSANGVKQGRNLPSTFSHHDRLRFCSFAGHWAVNRSPECVQRAKKRRMPSHESERGRRRFAAGAAREVVRSCSLGAQTAKMRLKLTRYLHRVEKVAA